MDVFVIPFGGDRYELYYEQSPEAEVDAVAPPRGVLGRLVRGFTVMLRAAEERQRRPQEAEAPQGWLARAQDRMLGWVARRIAEQRLLWNLRKQTTAVAMHPPDLAFEAALSAITKILKGDYERHRLWLIVDTIGFVASGVFFFVPGPNLIAYFFAFRVVGHWLSMRGAAQGLQRIVWTGAPCRPLASLRDAADLDAHARRQRIDQVAADLRLPNLSSFYERLLARRPKGKTG